MQLSPLLPAPPAGLVQSARVERVVDASFDVRRDSLAARSAAAEVRAEARARRTR